MKYLLTYHFKCFTLLEVIGGHYIYIPVHTNYHFSSKGYKESNDLYIPGKEGMICGLTSQVVSYNGKNYFVDRDGIKCFNNDMKLSWKSNIQNKASKSHILIKDDKLYLFNFGFGMRGKNIKKCTGSPFVAVFNTKDGSNIKYEEIAGDKITMTGIEERGDEIFILLDNSLAKMSLKDNSLKVNTNDTTSLGSFNSMLSGDDYYVRTSEDTFAPIGSLTSNAIAYTSKNKIVEVSLSKKEPVELCQPNDIYITIARSEGNKFLFGVEKRKKVIWYITNSKAIKLYDDIRSTRMNDNTLEVLTNSGKLCFINLK